MNETTTQNDNRIVTVKDQYIVAWRLRGVTELCEDGQHEMKWEDNGEKLMCQKCRLNGT
jgi:hypothetical protein